MNAEITHAIRWRHVAVMFLLLLGMVMLQRCTRELCPSEVDFFDKASTTGEQCLASPTFRCIWAHGPDSYWKCLEKNMTACAAEQAAGLVLSGIGVLVDLSSHSTARLEAVDVGAAVKGYTADVKACLEGVDTAYVIDNCPSGKAPRMCLDEAAVYCVDHGPEAGMDEVTP